MGNKKDVIAGGWIGNGFVQHSKYAAQCGGYDTFWGYQDGAKEGYVEATFKGSGIGFLDFGNCGKQVSGMTKVYLNGLPIASAGSNQQSKVINFSYKSGDTIRITEEQTAIIKINSFRLDACE